MSKPCFTVPRSGGSWPGNNLVVATVLFFIATVVLIAISAPVGIWLTILSGFVFGTWMGTLIVNLGATIGAGTGVSIRAIRVCRGDTQNGRHVPTAESTPWLQLMKVSGTTGRIMLCSCGSRRSSVLRGQPGSWTDLGSLAGLLVGHSTGNAAISLAVANTGASLAEITSFREVLSLRVLGALCLLPLVPFALHPHGRALVGAINSE